jgi:hypothetical protein
MPEYTLIVKIPNAGDKEFRHTFNLPSSFVDFPSDYFRKPENRTKLQNDIENQSGRQVTDADLEVFIKEWCWDIRQGLTPTTVSRDLLPLGTATYFKSYDDSRRDKTEISTGSNTHSAIPKEANPVSGSGTSSGAKSKSQNTANTHHHNSEETQNQELPKTEKWSTNNKADF